MQTTTLYLIRHGEAHANVNPGGPVAGMKGDLGLTDLRRKQLNGCATAWPPARSRPTR